MLQDKARSIFHLLERFSDIVCHFVMENGWAWWTGHYQHHVFNKSDTHAFCTYIKKSETNAFCTYIFLEWTNLETEFIPYKSRHSKDRHFLRLGLNCLFPRTDLKHENLAFLWREWFWIQHSNLEGIHFRVPANFFSHAWRTILSSFGTPFWKMSSFRSASILYFEPFFIRGVGAVYRPPLRGCYSLVFFSGFCWHYKLEDWNQNLKPVKNWMQEEEPNWWVSRARLTCHYSFNTYRPSEGDWLKHGVLISDTFPVADVVAEGLAWT